MRTHDGNWSNERRRPKVARKGESPVLGRCLEEYNLHNASLTMEKCHRSTDERSAG